MQGFSPKPISCNSILSLYSIHSLARERAQWQPALRRGWSRGRGRLSCEATCCASTLRAWTCFSSCHPTPTRPKPSVPPTMPSATAPGASSAQVGSAAECCGLDPVLQIHLMSRPCIPRAERCSRRHFHLCGRARADRSRCTGRRHAVHRDLAGSAAEHPRGACQLQVRSSQWAVGG